MALLILNVSDSLASKILPARRSYSEHAGLVNHWTLVQEKAEVKASTEAVLCTP